MESRISSWDASLLGSDFVHECVTICTSAQRLAAKMSLGCRTLSVLRADGPDLLLSISFLIHVAFHCVCHHLDDLLNSTTSTRNLSRHFQALAAAASGASVLSVVTGRASMRKPLFASNRCLRSKPFTKSRVALPIAPAMLLASTFIVWPSEPTWRSSYFSVTLYVFKMISLNGRLFAGWVCQFSLAHFVKRFSAAFSVASWTKEVAPHDQINYCDATVLVTKPGRKGAADAVRRWNEMVRAAIAAKV